MKTTPIFILLLTLAAFAVEPNSVKTTIHKVGKDGTGTEKDLVTTSYSDGLGRQIQSKVKINATEDRTACTFYDEAGRPEFSTKAFVDGTNHGLYLPGTLGNLIDDDPEGPLWAQYGDDKPYSYTKYSDDPLGRVVEQNGPGAQFSTKPVKVWYFGVSLDSRTFNVTSSATQTTYSAVFSNGFLVSTTISDDFLSALYTHLLVTKEFEPPQCTACEGAAFFLTISKDPLGTYSQGLADQNSNTVATRADPSSTAGDEIVSGYEYDILGRVLVEKAPSSLTPAASIDNSVYTYNTLGQLVNRTSPDGGYYEFAYTESGQVEYDYLYASSPGALIRSRRYTYDDLDRLVKIGLFDGRLFVDVQKNFYDDIDELLEVAEKYGISKLDLESLENLKGRLVASVVFNKVNNITYNISDLFSYDDEGRIKRKIKNIPGMPTQNTGFQYDLQGKVLSDAMTCGGDVVIRNYRYDAEGRLQKVVHANNGDKEVASFHYDPLSRLDYKTLGTTGGHRIDFKYNIREWITAIAPPSDNTYANKFSQFLNATDAYFDNGNIRKTQYLFNRSGHTADQYDFTYTYDNVNRLTGVIHEQGTKYDNTYEYDVIGRFRRKKEDTDDKNGYKYYTGTSRLKNTKNTDVVDYVYDPNGNMVVDVGKKMVVEYDWRDMPVTFRFYNALPDVLPCDARGTFNGDPADPRAFVEAANKTLLSQVVMLYDASGNRVMKMEGK